MTTNIDLLLGILGDEEFRAERVHTALLDERLAEWSKPANGERAVRKAALAAALGEAATSTANAKVLSRIPTAYRNVPSQPRTRSYEIGGEQSTVSYRGTRAGLVQSELEGITIVSTQPIRVVLDDDGVTETYAIAAGNGWVDVDGPDGSFDLTPIPEFVDPADVIAEGSLLAPMPAAVMSVAVTEGQQVSKGDIVVVLEAMKMQHTITAPYDGVVTELSAKTGAQVESGAVLAIIEGAQE